jgi:hypothetical protein
MTSTDELAREIASYLYHDCGYSLNQVAAELQEPKTTLRDAIRKPLRPVDQARAVRLADAESGKLADLMDDVFAAMRQERSANETARRLGCSPDAILYHWRRGMPC